MRHLGLRHQPFGRRHDRGDAALVVGAKQRGAGRGDDVVAEAFAEVGHVGNAQNGLRIVGQDQVTAVVGAMDDGLHASAAHLGRGIDVRDEADHRHAGLRRGRRDSGHHVAVFVHRRVGHAHGSQLGDEIAQQHELPGVLG